MECNFNAETCPHCGRAARRDPRGALVRRMCVPRPPDLTPAADRLGVSLADVGRYAAALTRWTLAGLPTRTDSQVAALYALCTACPRLTGDRCSACRCRVAPSGLAMANKLRMATEACPLGKWQ